MKIDLFLMCCKDSMKYRFKMDNAIQHKLNLFYSKDCSNHVPNYLYENLILHSCQLPMSHLSFLLTRKLSHFYFMSSIYFRHADIQQIAFEWMDVVIAASTKSSTQNFHLSILNLCILHRSCLLMEEG
jgi:hypothetical protein